MFFNVDLKKIMPGISIIFRSGGHAAHKYSQCIPLQIR